MRQFMVHWSFCGRVIPTTRKILAGQASSAYEALAAHIETACESTVLDIEGKPHVALLIACPAMAWSRAVIAAGKIRPDTFQALHAQLHAHVLAPG
jgi:hypothetical protein